MHHVYSLSTPSGVPFHVGILPGALGVHARPDDVLTVHYGFETRPEAEAYQRQLAGAWGVYSDVVVLCEQTNVTYANANQAAKALGASQAAVSQHLRGKTGYRTVKGFTFRHIPAHLAPRAPDPATPQEDARR